MNNNSSKYHSVIITKFIRERKYDEAIEYINKDFEFNIISLNNIAYLFLYKGEYDIALYYLNKIDPLEYNDHILQNYFYAYFKLENYELALEYLLKMNRINNNYVKICYSKIKSY